MIELQATKVVVLTPPAAKVDNAAFTTASLDTKGWDHVLILCILGDIDIDMVALKLQESDADSGYADITGLIYGTSAMPDGTTSALPTAAAGDNKVFAFDVNLVGRKRYLDVAATGGDGSAGTYMTVIAILSRGQESPTTYAERGLAGLLAV